MSPHGADLGADLKTLKRAFSWGVRSQVRSLQVALDSPSPAAETSPDPRGAPLLLGCSAAAIVLRRGSAFALGRRAPAPRRCTIDGLSAFDDIAGMTPQQIWDGVLGRSVHGERITLGVIELDPDSLVPEHSHENE